MNHKKSKIILDFAYSPKYNLSMKKLSTEKRARIVAALVEGCSIRATSRMVDVAQNSILKLLGDLGEACAKYHDENVRGLECHRIECDEIWAFNYCKKSNIPNRLQHVPNIGDVWTWAGLCADSKLIGSVADDDASDQFGIEASVAVKKIVNCCKGVRSIPNDCAIKIAITAS